MEDESMVSFLPTESNRGSESLAVAESPSESTRSNSLESGVTVESSRFHDADTRPDECSGWTNEKHNSYLDYLEKSFVRQLYCLVGEKTKRSYRTHDLSANSHKSTDKFSVLQNGFWQKINFGTKRTHLDPSSDCNFHENPLTSHSAEPSLNFGATTVRGNLLCNKDADHSGDKAFSRTSSRNPVGHNCMIEITAEASGQNFTDEETEEKASHSPASKRHKRDPKPECSTNEQVVPLGTVKR